MLKQYTLRMPGAVFGGEDSLDKLTNLVEDSAKVAVFTDKGMFDVWCLLIFGLIAVVIRAMELPIMPVAIGFILGPIFEKNLRRAESFMTSGPAELLHHPIALVILVITVVMIIFSLRSNKRAAEREAAAAAAEEQE